MNNEYEWWMLILGVALGAFFLWLLIGRLPRREVDVEERERAAEARWISETIGRWGGAAPPELVAQVLDLHREYLAEPDPSVILREEPAQPDLGAETPPAAQPSTAEGTVGTAPAAAGVRDEEATPPPRRRRRREPIVPTPPVETTGDGVGDGNATPRPRRRRGRDAVQTRAETVETRVQAVARGRTDRAGGSDQPGGPDQAGRTDEPGGSVQPAGPTAETAATGDGAGNDAPTQPLRRRRRRDAAPVQSDDARRETPEPNVGQPG